MVFLFACTFTDNSLQVLPSCKLKMQLSRVPRSNVKGFRSFRFKGVFNMTFKFKKKIQSEWEES